MTTRLFLASLLLLLFSTTAPTARTELPAAPVDPGSVLADYVARPDDSFEWWQRSTSSVGNGSEYVELILTSQTWKGIPWHHQLYIIRPADVDADSPHALLMVDGGRWRDALLQPPEGSEPLPDNADLFIEIAEHLRAPVAVLRHVPHQPLFDGLTEDHLIAKTFASFLETGDPDWPLLLPMVKSAVRAMDAVEAFAAQEWGLATNAFTVIGASKRGWTTWLTGAVDDRVAAIAPIVIDMLNTDAYLRHAERVWEQQSAEIEPYTELGLHESLESPGRQALLRIVDPWHYLETLSLPKLLILATNDEYWPLDTLNLYWDDLPGEKHVIYVPNNRHRVEDFTRIVTGVIALHEHAAGKARLPQMQWDYRSNATNVELVVQSDPQPDRVRVWLAESDTRDMRKAEWTAHTVEPENGRIRYRAEPATDRYRALFAEVEYTSDRAAPLFLSTTVRVLKPDADR